MSEDGLRMSWNLSVGLITQINNLLTNSGNNYTQGNIKQAFYYAQGVKMRIVHTLNIEERIALQKKEDLIAKLIRLSIHSANKNPEQSNALMDFAAFRFTQYNESLMDLLEKYGYLIEKRADASKMSF